MMTSGGPASSAESIGTEIGRAGAFELIDACSSATGAGATGSVGVGGEAVDLRTAVGASHLRKHASSGWFGTQSDGYEATAGTL